MARICRAINTIIPLLCLIRLIFFDVDKEDSVSYVHNHLQLLTPEKSRDEDRQIIATERDRIDVELDPYITDEDIIMDLNK